MPGAVEQLIRDRVGGLFDAPTSSANPTTSAARILRQNPDRVTYLLVNTGSQQIFIGFNEGVTDTTGIPIGPNGGTLVVSVEEDLTLPTFPVFALTSVGTGTLLAVEIVRVAESLPG